MRFPRTVLALVGLFFLAIGVAFFLNAPGAAGALMLRSKGLNPVSIRAVDGGLQLGLGVFFLVASTRPRWIRAGLGAAMLSGGGLAFGRIVGMWKEQLYEREQLAFVAFEALIVLAALAAFVRARAVFEASLADRRRTE